MICNSELSNHNFTIKIATFLFLLICLVTSSRGLTTHKRFKRGTVTIEDLPQIKPPTILKRGEPKYPSPGWTHCIKYLTADVRWRSIRGMNTKKLQATQFQCSWFITTEVPGTQIRLSFEKLDFGNDKGSSCTQQFLELIDIKLGKSQGRICGDKKRVGDYVSVGQRVRIDIQGEESLVEKIRAKKDPFIISYKLVREPPGFRVGGSTSKNKELTNTVKKTVGIAVGDKPKTIYGSKNQPGKDHTNLTLDDPNESGGSLAIWHVIIIIFASFALIACIIGVLVKRMIFDKRKKEEYLNIEASKISDSHKQADAMILPGLASKISHVSEKKSPKSDHKHKKTKRPTEPPAYENIQRSTSKPEGSVKKAPPKVKRHNSHGDANTKTKTAKHRTKATENEKQNGHSEGSKVTKPVNEAAKKTENKLTVTDDTPSNRPSGKATAKAHDNKKATKKAHSPTGEAKRHHRKTDENKNNVKPRSPHKEKSSGTHKHRSKSQQRHKTSGTEKVADKAGSTETKKSVEKDDTPPSRPNKSAAKHGPTKTRPHKSNHSKSDADKHKHHKEHSSDKKNEHRKERAHKTDGDLKADKSASKKRKTVSSAHKKATSPNGRKVDSSKKSHSGHRRHKISETKKGNSESKSKPKNDVTKPAT